MVTVFGDSGQTPGVGEQLWKEPWLRHAEVHVWACIHTQSHPCSPCVVYFLHRNLSTLLKLFLPYIFFFLSLSLQPLSKSSWGIEHPKAVTETTTTVSPAWAVGQTCWALLETESWAQEFWGCFCPSVTLPAQSMTRGQSKGRGRADLGVLAGRAADLESFCSPCRIGCWSKPSLGQKHLEGFVFNSFTCQVSVNLLTSITALHACQHLGWWTLGCSVGKMLL